MMLRQEAALDRSIDRKVRILWRLRKEFTNLPTAPSGQHDGARMENIEEALDSDIVPDNSQSVGMVEDLKLNERYGNVIENKGSRLENWERNGNVIEDKGSCALRAGMLLKRQLVPDGRQVAEVGGEYPPRPPLVPSSPAPRRLPSSASSEPSGY
jgi:hypothetical protein